MRKLPVPLNTTEFLRLLRVTKQEKYKVAFKLAFGSGLRISEVVHLEKRDFDMKNKTILVRQGKGKKDRVVPIPKGFRDYYINLIPIGVGVRSLQYAFISSAQKSGLLEIKPSASFHSLRHGFGTRLAGEGVPIHHVRTLMGHSNISTTNVYLEANPKEAIKWYEDKF